MARTRGGSLSREILAIRRSLSALDKALSRFAERAGDTDRRRAVSPERSRRKLKLSPARLKALKLHGSYMGYIRQLKPRAKTQVPALRASKGLRVAIALGNSPQVDRRIMHDESWRVPGDGGSTVQSG
jgi:hypothetical protein